MTYSTLDPEHFLSDGVFLEGNFLEKADSFDWEQFRAKQVLVRGCSSAIIPPWAFMFITGKLSALAKTVRYGNEHDNIVVYRASGSGQEAVQRVKAVKK